MKTTQIKQLKQQETLFADIVSVHMSGKLDEAERRYRDFIAKFPQYSYAHCNLGLLLKALGRVEEAESLYREAIRLNPRYPQAYNNLGNLLRERGFLDEAISACKKSIELQPNSPEAYNNLGNALQESKRSDEAIIPLEKAIHLKPDYAEAYNNLGNALYDLMHLTEAIAAFDEAIRLRPDFIRAHYNKANALRELPQLDKAIESYQEAIRLAPDFSMAIYNEAMTHLLRGDLLSAWPKYEARWNTDPWDKRIRNFDRPLLKVVDISIQGKIVLVHAEQGLGDTIQMARYIPLLAKQGAIVILEVQKPLKQLIATLPGVDKIYIFGEQLPHFDFHCPIMSLPLVFGTTIETIPNNIPYVSAQQELVHTLNCELKNHHKFKVGICWKGSSAYGLDKQRSPGIEPFKALFKIDGAEFYTLVPQSRNEFADATQTSGVDLGRELDESTAPFEETAALIMNLDLVITCDTVIGHLAGALGKPVWTVLPLVPHWPWMMYREDSFWYPSVRLFRQSARGDWNELFERVAKKLNDVISNKEQALWDTNAPEMPSAGDKRLLRTQVSVGELLDKITILQIKASRITDPNKLSNIKTELAALSADVKEIPLDNAMLQLMHELKEVNNLLWDVEDALRECENKNDFSAKFIDLARSVYKHNDKRALLKKKLNELTGSALVEEKSYTNYDGGHSTLHNDINYPSLETLLGNPKVIVNNCHIRRARHGVLLYNKFDKFIGFSIEHYGEFSEPETEVFKNVVRAGDTVVEAGSNIGVHTVILSQLVGIKGVVHAFEPQRIIYQMLCANLALNEAQNVYTHFSAVGANRGKINIPAVNYGERNNFGGISLGGSGGGEEIPVITIDSLTLTACKLIKVDVEGMETDVLAGARATITKFRPFLYVENDRMDKSPELIQMIMDLGYRIWWHLPMLFNPNNYCQNKVNYFPNTVSINMFCVPKEFSLQVEGLNEVLSADEHPLHLK